MKENKPVDPLMDEPSLDANIEDPLKDNSTSDVNVEGTSSDVGGEGVSRGLKLALGLGFVVIIGLLSIIVFLVYQIMMIDQVNDDVILNNQKNAENVDEIQEKNNDQKSDDDQIPTDDDNPPPLEDENEVFTDQQIYENSSLKIVYPGDWNIEEGVGVDGSGVWIHSPQKSNGGGFPSSAKFKINYGLAVPIAPGVETDCTKGDVIKSDVSDITYRKIQSFSAMEGVEYIVCESYNGTNFNVPPVDEGVFTLEITHDGYFSNELDLILKNIVRK